MFVGFLEGVNGFKMWHTIEKKFIVSRDITFRESKMFMHKEDKTKDKTETFNSKIEVEKIIEPPIEANIHSESEDEEETRVEQPKTLDPQLDLCEYSLARDRQRRVIVPPARYVDTN